MRKELLELCKDYKSIETAADLRRRKLTLADYHAIALVISEITETNTSKIFMDKVCSYFKKFGVPVCMDEHNVNSIIGWRE